MLKDLTESPNILNNLSLNNTFNNMNDRNRKKGVAVPKNERNGSNIQKMYQFIPWNMSFHARYNSWRGIIKLPTDIRV